MGDIEVAEEVNEIIDRYCEENDITIDEIPYDSLGCIFAGTEIEKYKDDIEEW